MESIDIMKHLSKPGEYMTTIDLKDAYFSVPIHTHDRKYLRFGKILYMNFRVSHLGIVKLPGRSLRYSSPFMHD